MIDIFTSFYKSNTAVVFDVFKIIVPCLLTYFFTSKNLKAPKRIEIKQNQFDLVYLPLYLLVKQYDIANNKDNISIFIKRLDKIIYKNYQYVYPKTINLYDKFKNQIHTKNPNYLHITSFIYQIEEDYEKLKLELGYPTTSMLNNFKRMNKIDKILYICIFITGAMLVYGVSSIYIYIINGDWGNAIINILPAALSFLVLYTMIYIKKN